MKDFLSNEEIDTLLELFRAEGGPIDEGQVAIGFEAEVVDEGPTVSEVDLLRPNRFTRDHVQSLERLFEGTAKALAEAIGDKLRFDVHCDCVAIEQMRFQSWLSAIGGRSAIYVVEMPPFRGPLFVTFTTGLLYGAVDRVLGGAGRVHEERTDFSPAEYAVADAFVSPCLDKLCDSLGELGEFSWRVVDRFCNPSRAQILPAQDVLLAAHFQVSSEYLPGDMRLAIPFAAIEPLLAAVAFGPGSRDRVRPGSHRDNNAAIVRRVPIELSVLLGRTELALRELLELRVGDVVTLPTRVGDPLEAPVAGKVKFRGHVGQRGSRLAFRVSHLVES